MTKKSLLSGFGYFLGAGVLATGLTMTGCGDDETPVTQVDAGEEVDAMSNMDAAGCTGHGCPTGENPWGLTAENGEIRLEYFKLADGESKLAAQAFFFKNQDPANRGFGGTPVDSPTAEAAGVSCGDLTGGVYFNNGASAEAVQILATREYIDVGPFINFTNKDDASDVIALPKKEGVVDLSQNLQHDIIYQVDDPLLTPAFNVGYDVSFEGLGPDLTDGTSVQMDWTTNNIEVYMPPPFTMANPVEDAFFADGLTFTKGQDLTLQWSLDEALNADSASPASFVGFVNAETNQVESYCIKIVDDGELLVPAEILEVVSPSGNLLVGTITHVAYKGENEGRVDVQGITCKLAGYTIEDAAAAAK